jgi:hypothetical protein
MAAQASEAVHAAKVNGAETCVRRDTCQQLLGKNVPILNGGSGKRLWLAGYPSHATQPRHGLGEPNRKGCFRCP